MPTHNGPFPGKEADRNSYYGVACPYLLLAANVTRLGISAGNKATLQSAYTAWNNAYPLSQNPNTRTTTTIADKNNADDDLQTIMRTIFGDIPDSALTSTDRSTLNLPEHSNSHTPAPVPTSAPVATIDSGNRLEHSISVVDENTPTSRAKPDGVRGCQVWEKIGAPAPVSATDLIFVAETTKSPFVNHFNGADAGKMVYYWMRWVNTRGEVGPWSTMVSATIGG